MADDQDNTRRGGAIEPHVHKNRTRHVVDDLDADGSSKNRKMAPATTSTTPMRQLLASANAEMTPQGTQAVAAVRTQRPDTAREGENR